MPEQEETSNGTQKICPQGRHPARSGLPAHICGGAVQVRPTLYNKNSTPSGVLFLLWARQDLNPRPSGYENVANFEIPFFLWNLVTV